MDWVRTAPLQCVRHAPAKIIAYSPGFRESGGLPVCFIFAKASRTQVADATFYDKIGPSL